MSTNGVVSAALTSQEAALPVGSYTSYLVLYEDTNTMGVVDVCSLRVLWAPDDSVAVVGVVTNALEIARATAEEARLAALFAGLTNAIGDYVDPYLATVTNETLPDASFYWPTVYDLAATWGGSPHYTVSTNAAGAEVLAAVEIGPSCLDVRADVARARAFDPAAAWSLDAPDGFSLSSNGLSCTVSWPGGTAAGTAFSVSCAIEGVSRTLSAAVPPPTRTQTVFSAWAAGSVQEIVHARMADIAWNRRGEALYGAGFVRDTNCWVAAWDFSCTSVSNSSTGRSLHPLTLVSSNLALGARHVLAAYTSSPAMTWADGAGNCYTSRPVAWAGYGEDGLAVRLDPPLPDAILPASLLTPREAVWFNGNAGTVFRTADAGTDIAYLRQDLTCWAGEVYVNARATGKLFPAAPTRGPNRAGPDKAHYFDGPTFAVGGDSGSPVFLLLPSTNRPCLLWTFHKSSGTGTAPANDWDAFARALRSLGLPEDAPVRPDLSAYPQYPVITPEGTP